MEEQTRLSLKQKYSVMPDEELIAMIAVGKEEYESEAYDLLLAEARRRGIEESPVEQGEDIYGKKKEVLPGNEDQPQTFVQLVIVVNDTDKRALESILEAASLPYYLQELNIRGKEWPMGLMVEQHSFEDAIEILSQRFKPSGSLLLW